MENKFFSTVQMRILGALSLLMLMIALASYAILNFEQVRFVNPTPATITVTGEGEVLTVPDVGQFSFSVTADSDDAATAQEISGTKINDILAYLKEQNIEDKDVKVQNYSLYPKWKYEERICPFGSYCPPGEQVQDGFTVSQSVSVKVRDTKAAPAIIAGIGERGATDISNLNFTIDDIDALQADARTKAITDAKEKAAVLAKQLNVRLVRLVSYYENSGNNPPYMEVRTQAYDKEESAFGGAELPVGEQSTIIQVNVTYEIK